VVRRNKQRIDWDVQWWFVMMRHLRWTWHDDYMTEMIHDDTQRFQNNILFDEQILAGRILPSWEGVLIFAIAVKFHLGQLKWTRWWLHYILLFERSRINLKITQFSQAEVELWIILFIHVLWNGSALTTWVTAWASLNPKWTLGKTHK